MSDIIIKTTVIPAVTEVYFYEETVGHVGVEHPEIPLLLPSVYAAVTNTIVNPTHIERSYGNSYVYVDTTTTNASGDPLRVPVKVVDGTSARLKTVYFAESPAGTEIVWSRP